MAKTKAKPKDARDYFVIVIRRNHDGSQFYGRTQLKAGMVMHIGAFANNALCTADTMSNETEGFKE